MWRQPSIMIDCSLAQSNLTVVSLQTKKLTENVHSQTHQKVHTTSKAEGGYE